MVAVLLNNKPRKSDFGADLAAGQRGEIRPCKYHRAYCGIADTCNDMLFYPFLYGGTEVAAEDVVCVNKDEIRYEKNQKCIL